jgi:hypothetical protein
LKAPGPHAGDDTLALQATKAASGIVEARLGTRLHHLVAHHDRALSSSVHLSPTTNLLPPGAIGRRERRRYTTVTILDHLAAPPTPANPQSARCCTGRPAQLTFRSSLWSTAASSHPSSNSSYLASHPSIRYSAANNSHASTNSLDSPPRPPLRVLAIHRRLRISAVNPGSSSSFGGCHWSPETAVAAHCYSSAVSPAFLPINARYPEIYKHTYSVRQEKSQQ